MIFYELGELGVLGELGQWILRTTTLTMAMRNDTFAADFSSRYLYEIGTRERADFTTEM